MFNASTILSFVQLSPILHQHFSRTRDMEIVLFARRPVYLSQKIYLLIDLKPDFMIHWLKKLCCNALIKEFDSKISILVKDCIILY